MMLAALIIFLEHFECDSVNPANQPCMTRTIFSEVDRIYDPLGLITPVPVVLIPKIQDSQIICLQLKYVVIWTDTEMVLT